MKGTGCFLGLFEPYPFYLFLFFPGSRAETLLNKIIFDIVLKIITALDIVLFLLLHQNFSSFIQCARLHYIGVSQCGLPVCGADSTSIYLYSGLFKTAHTFTADFSLCKTKYSCLHSLVISATMLLLFFFVCFLNIYVGWYVGFMLQ